MELNRTTFENGLLCGSIIVIITNTACIYKLKSFGSLTKGFVFIILMDALLDIIGNLGYIFFAVGYYYELIDRTSLNCTFTACVLILGFFGSPSLSALLSKIRYDLVLSKPKHKVG